MIEGLIVLALFVALAILAVRYGADSRDGIRSREHDLALRGMTWNELAFQHWQLERSAARAERHVVNGSSAEPATPLVQPAPLAGLGLHPAAALEQEVAA